MIKLALKWSKWISLGFIALLIVLVLSIAGLLFTNTGLNFALWGVNKFVPQLEVKSTYGSLFPRFTLNDVRFVDSSLNVDMQLRSATLAINANCFLEPSICINDISLSGLKLSLPSLPESDEIAEETESQPLTNITTPVPIRLNRLTLNDIELNILGNSIAWQHFSTQASFQGNNLTIGTTVWNHIDVTLANSTVEPTPEQPKPESESVPKTIVLPNILIPLRFDLSRLDINNFTLHQETPVVVNHLGLKAQVYQYDVSVDTLELDTPEVDAWLKTKVKLKDSYPLSLELTSKVKLEQAKGQALSLKASGSVADLSLQAELTELVQASINAKLKPLESQLPLDIDIKNLHGQWPLVGKGDYFVTASHVYTKGSLKHYQLGLNGQLKGKDLPTVAIDTEGEGDLSEISLRRIQIDTLGGRILGEINANWDESINWQAKLDLNHIQPGLQWPEAEGIISGKVETSGKLTTQGGWLVKVPQLAIDGVVRDYPLHIHGQIDASDVSGKGQYEVTTRGINLAHGPNEVTAKGKLDKEWRMSLSLNLPDLSKTVPDLKGKVKGDVILRGALAEPRIRLSLDADSIAWQQDAKVKHITLTGNVSPLPKPQADLRLKVTDASYQEQRINSVVMHFSGEQQKHELSLEVKSDIVSTSLNIQGALKDNPSLIWDGQLNRMKVETEQGAWSLDKPTQIDVDVDKQSVTLAAHCWIQAGSSVCLDKSATVGENGEVQLSINQFNFEQIKAFIPSESHVNGEANAKVWAKWQTDKPPQIKLELSLPKGSVTQDLEQPLKVGWEQVSLQATLLRNRLQAYWNVDMTDNGDLSGNISIADVTKDNKRMEGELKLSTFNLDFLSPLVGEYSSLKSNIESELKFKGDMLHPQVEGLLSVKDIQVKGDISPVEVESGQVTLNFTGYQANLNASVLTQDGELKITGDADWQNLDDWKVNSHVFAQSLLVDLPPIVKVKVVPDLTLNMQPKLAKVTGNITLPWGRIVVEELPQSAVSVSKDQVLLNEDLTPISEQNTLPFDIETDVTITIGDDFKLQAFGLEGGLVGRVNVVQKDKGPLVNGEINIQGGKYRAFGQDLIIQEGKILMNGPVDQPYLSIKAIRNPENTEDDVIAGVQVTGPATEPLVSIFSEPSMPQANALSYLLRGQDIDSESGGDAMTTALIGLSLAKSGKVVSEIGSAFGVQDLKLDTAGSGDESQVTVSGYIRPGLQVKYGVGIFNSVGEFTIRYRLMTDLYVEAVSGLDSAVDLLYQFELN
ncbi:autotransporter assembly complex protein TamB [Vibrio ziniensis]|uniref:Translocation/assembly module TamB n=1 Tax=Vibrio ziniensis TaxID=2711221 RepID=A0A6G7CF83_9VIBR|nr:translocation/assembly module TamB domain-containing protein [Vibrio ziniensis]QIH40754.1 translocation/assembly module TamB [Vibrio ziniensis]